MNNNVNQFARLDKLQLSAKIQLWTLIRLSCALGQVLVVLLAVNLLKDWIIKLFS